MPYFTLENCTKQYRGILTVLKSHVQEWAMLFLNFTDLLCYCLEFEFLISSEKRILQVHSFLFLLLIAYFSLEHLYSSFAGLGIS